MVTIKWIAFYCGHGGMNYIEIRDSTDTLQYKIVVDAGSNDDRSIGKISLVNYQTLYDLLWVENPGIPVILCITHYDEDHYNFFDSMYSKIIENAECIEKIYFGSLTKDSFKALAPEAFVKKVFHLLKEKVSILDQISSTDSLVKVEDAEFGILWNNLCKNRGVNDNSAAYYLMNTTTYHAYIFTGDITGNTYLALKEDFEDLESEIHEKFQDYFTIVTVPHHGSINTLLEGGFIKIHDFNMRPLIDAMNRLSLSGGKFILSTGVKDMFRHPDNIAAKTFNAIANQENPINVCCPIFFTYALGRKKNYKCWYSIKARGICPTTYMENKRFKPKPTYYYLINENGKIEQINTEFIVHNLSYDDNENSYLPLDNTIIDEIPLIIKDNQISFKQLFSDLGKMYYYDQLALRFDSQPIDNLILSEYTWDGINFEGILDVSQSKLSFYSWLLANTKVSGAFKDGCLTGESEILPINWNFSPLPIQIKNTKLVFTSHKINDVLMSEVYLSISMTIGTQMPIEGLITYQLLGEKRLTIKFQGEEGLAVSDCTVLLSDLLGTSVDFVQLLPSALPFIPSVRLYTLDVYCKNDLLSAQTNAIDIYSIGFCIGYQQEHNYSIQEAGIELTDIRFNIFASIRQASLSNFSASMNATLKLFGLSFTLTASYPTYFIELYNTLKTTIPIAEIIEKYGLSLPTWLQQTSIGAIYLSSTPDLSQSRLSMTINDLITTELTSSTKITLSSLSLDLEKSDRDTIFTLETNISFNVEDKNIAGFFVTGEFSSDTVIFKGALATSETAFADFYNAIAGKQLPTSFPNVELLNMALEAEYNQEFILRTYNAGVKITVSDTSVFGIAFEMQASIAGTAATFTVSGSFLLNDIFTIYAQIFLSNNETQWKFGLLFAKVMIEVAYTSSPQSCIKGIIKSNLTLKDAVNAMISLMSDEETYVSSADWKILDDINLNGIEIAYYFDQQKMQLTVIPNISLPFAKIEKLSVIMSKNGVDFNMAGTFMDQTYTEDHPLTWDAQNPPQPNGSFMRINYMLLSDNVQVDLGNVTEIEKAIEKIEEFIPPDKESTSLIMNSKAGFLGAIDTQVADAVQIQLLYDEWVPFYGARFYLFGDKAGKLKGLDAQVNYTRLQGNTGVFSGRITPPDALKVINLGNMTIGIGEISAMIYTNGNFYIDLGYPNERNFSRSFSFSYGIFEGKGGVYIQKGITHSLSIPKTSKGYFSPVLAMGIGIRLSIGQSVKAGPLAASASLVMQGIFEGVYATYLSYSGNTETYYRVAAQVSFEGKLQGSVDFGIIGASVTICILAKSNLILEAFKPVYADLGMRVEAAASIKIWFCRINFHFATSFQMHLEFASGGHAPWSNAIEDYNAPLCDQLPQTLHFTPTMNAEKHVLPLKIAVIYGRDGDNYTSIISALMSKADYATLITLLTQALTENNYLHHTDGEELFKAGRFFSELEWLEEFISTYIIFELDFDKNAVEEDSVIVPLPDCLKITVSTNYVYGVSDYAERNLHDYFLINDVYLKALQDYYEDTMYVPQNTGTGKYAAAVKSGSISLQAQIFSDYFELMVKAIRTEMNHSLRSNKSWNHQALDDEQNENIIGLTSRFMLGGKRGSIIEQNHLNGNHRAGLWKLSGTQIALPYSDDVKNYKYTIEEGTKLPTWLRFSGSKERLTCVMNKSEVQKLLPATRLPKDYYTTPVNMPVFESVKANGVQVDKILAIKDSNAAYYQASSSLRNGVNYETSEYATLTYGSLIQLRLQKCRYTKAMYRILASENSYSLKNCLQRECKVVKIELLYLAQLEDDAYTAYDSDNFYQLSNKLFNECEDNFTTIKDSQKFAEMLSVSCTQEAENYLGFLGNTPLPPIEEQTIYLAIHFEAKDYLEYFNFVYLQSSANTIKLLPDCMVNRSVLAQGAAGIELSVDSSQLSEAEKLLADQYQNIAAEVKESQSGKVSHETLTFIGESKNDADNRTYQLVIPYCRALDGADCDVYDFVSKERCVEINLFWIDLFGNRMDLEYAYRLRPKYIDSLIAVHTYPAIELTYSMTQVEAKEVLRITFSFAGSSESYCISDDMKNVWASALYQLRQSDVTMSLLSDALPETKIMDKEKLTSFLKDCIDQSTKP